MHNKEQEYYTGKKCMLYNQLLKSKDVRLFTKFADVAGGARNT